MKVKKDKKKYEAYMEKSQVHTDSYNLKDAKKFQKRALKMAKEHDEPEDIARSFCQKGDVLYKEGSYDKALKYFKKSLKMYIDIFDQDHSDVANFFKTS